MTQNTFVVCTSPTHVSRCVILTVRSNWDFRWWWHVDGIRIPVFSIDNWHLSVHFGCLLLLFRLHRMGMAGRPSERCRRVRHKRWLSANAHVRNQKVSSSIFSILSISIWPRNCTALTAYCSSLFLALCSLPLAYGIRIFSFSDSLIVKLIQALT